MQFDASLVGPILRETVAAMMANARVLAMVHVAATVVGVGYDLALGLLGEAALLYYVVYIFFMLFLQACVTIALLERGGFLLPGSRRWRIASLFGISIIAGLGIFFGLLVLVLPGLFLTGRWYLAAPALFHRDMSASEAMRASWDLTEQSWLSITLIAVAAFAVQAAPLLAAAYLLENVGRIDWPVSLAMNAASQAGWLLGVSAAATAYMMLGGEEDRMRKIFG